MSNADHQLRQEVFYDQNATNHQARADSAYVAHGLRAPMRVSGESIDDYRRRLLVPLLPHSERWRGISLSEFPGKALGLLEEKIFADSIATAQNPGPGMLRAIEEKDQSGRIITKFYGDPEVCWGPFKQQPRLVTGLNK